jgi:hypothetical protein
VTLQALDDQWVALPCSAPISDKAVSA